jgi:hypothetical protein
MKSVLVQQITPVRQYGGVASQERAVGKPPPFENLQKLLYAVVY